MQFSADQVQAAVAAATADMATAITTARAEATTAERERIKAIIESPAAASKPKQALAIAMAGSTVEAAAAVLAVTPPDATSPTLPSGRSKDAPGGLVVDGQGSSFFGSETATAWSKSVAKANGRVEAAMAAETNR